MEAKEQLRIRHIHQKLGEGPSLHRKAHIGHQIPEQYASQQKSYMAGRHENKIPFIQIYLAHAQPEINSTVSPYSSP